jgi:protein-tyrosine-phosphatase
MNLLRAGAPASRVHLMRAFDPSLAHARDEDRNVPDPYTGSTEGFQHVYDMLTAACAGLLDHIAKTHIAKTRAQ